MLRSGSDTRIVRLISRFVACESEPWPDCGGPSRNSPTPDRFRRQTTQTYSFQGLGPDLNSVRSILVNTTNSSPSYIVEKGLGGPKRSFWEALFWVLLGITTLSGLLVPRGRGTGVLGPTENSSRYMVSRGCYSTPGCGKAGEHAGMDLRHRCLGLSAAYHRRWAAHAMSLGFRVQCLGSSV